MEDILGALFVIIVVVINVAAKSSKNKQQAKSVIASMPTQKTKPVPTIRLDRPETREAKPIAQPKPMAAQVAQPKVHTHLTPECNLDAELAGSLQYDSPEGVDKCHEDELRPVNVPLYVEPLEQEKPGFSLNLSSDAMLQAVIMQEVLTRPCDRRRR